MPPAPETITSRSESESILNCLSGDRRAKFRKSSGSSLSASLYSRVLCLGVGLLGVGSFSMEVQGMRALRARFVLPVIILCAFVDRERRTAAFFIRYRSRQRRRDPRCDRGPEFRRKSGVHGDHRRGRQLSLSGADGGQLRADVLDARVRDDLSHGHADEPTRRPSTSSCQLAACRPH